MKRKVVKHGPASLIVSLPSKWAKKYSVKPGDEVEVAEDNNTLVLSTGKIETPLKKIAIDTRGVHELSAWFLVGSLHKAGFDEIAFVYDNPKVIQLAKQCIDSHLMGYEIVEQSHNNCTIKHLGGDGEVDFDQIVRRIFLVTLSLAKSSYETIQLGEIDKLEELLFLEQTNNKLVQFCERLISKKRYDENKAHFMYLIVWLLEKVADHYKDLIKALLSTKNAKPGSQVLIEYSKVNNLFESYYNLYYKYSLQKLLELKDRQQSVCKDLFQALVNAENEVDAAMLLQLTNVAQRINEFFVTTSILHL